MSTASTTEVAIRTADTDDLDALRRIAASAFDREPIGRAGLVDLLYHRPTADPTIRLVSDLGGRPVAFAFGSVHQRRGHLDAIAVDDSLRRQGLATTLLAAIEQRLIAAGAESLNIGGNTRFYGWPGVDLTYTAALAFAEHLGYRRRDVAQNMYVPLAGWIPHSADKVLKRHGGHTDARRATPHDWPELDGFLRRNFSEVWRHETSLAVHRATPSAHVATRNGRIVGFACHGVYRRDWFGPIGTGADERGNGVGEALLRLCLDDLAQAGISVAQIGWIGPMSFYS
ncbi:MAG: GNAT family N-acetyltransferase, partial [Sciscionella sp.]